MNRFFRLLAILLTATSLLACEDAKDDINATPKETIEIDLVDTELSFDVDGGAKTVAIQHKYPVTLETVGGEWLKYSKIVSIGSTTTFSVDVEKNNDLDAREGKVILSLKGAENVEINVTQPGISTLKTYVDGKENDKITINSRVKTKVIRVNAAKYTATINGEAADWLAVEQRDNNLLVKTTSRNMGTADRTASVTLHADASVYPGVANDVVLQVTQTFYGEPSISTNTLTFDYKKNSQLVEVHFDEAPYEVTIEENKPWLSYLITPEGLIMYTSVNYEISPLRSAQVSIKVKEDGGQDKFLTLTVNQTPVPAGGRPAKEADRYNWTAIAKDGHFLWGSAGTVNGQSYRGGNPMLVLDGQIESGWHTPVPSDTVNGGGPTSLPQCMVIDMKALRRISKIELLNTHYIKDVRVYLTINETYPGDYKETWGVPLAQTTGGENETIINISPLTGQPNSNFGQYLVLFFPTSTSGTHISICEVKVWEYPLP